MSLNTILSTATSGLLTAQTGLRTVSDNIANANTPGYVRKIVDQVSLASSGMGVGVDQVNSLLQQIDGLNADIIRAKSVGADATGSENIQNNLINQLSSLMNVQVQARPGGGVVLRTIDGTELAGDGAASVTYVRS